MSKKIVQLNEEIIKGQIKEQPQVFRQHTDLLVFHVCARLAFQGLTQNSYKKMDKPYNTDNLRIQDDSPTEESKEIYSYCRFLFAQESPLSLQEFIPYIQGFVMYLCTEMWYDAGELDVSMSDRTNEARQILRQQREGIKLLIMHAIEIRSAQYSNEAAN